MTLPIPLLSLLLCSHVERNPANLVDFPPQADKVIYLKFYMLYSTSYYKET